MKLPDPSPGSWQLDGSGLQLQLVLDDGEVHALHVDFVTGAMGYRRRHSGRRQAIAKAVGIKKGRALPRVWDLTAGLGRDSFVLACLGCEVLAVERDARVFALLQDGLQRAQENPQCAAELGGRLHLSHADAIAFLNRNSDGLFDANRDSTSSATQPDVLYLDPMHPPRRKSAQVRKEMRLFRALVGADPDAGQLLQAALAAAPSLGAQRVVVKRPRHGDLLGPQPNHQAEGKSTRFDIYLIQ